MSGDMFGNLRDWGAVLAGLNELKRSGKLDEHQAGLVRILRYKDNWRLREAVLGCLNQVVDPCAELVNEVLNLAMDENTYIEARILAVQALTCLMHDFKGTRDHEAAHMKSSVAEKMEALLRSPQPPLIHGAVKNSDFGFPAVYGSET